MLFYDIPLWLKSTCIWMWQTGRIQSVLLKKKYNIFIHKLRIVYDVRSLNVLWLWTRWGYGSFATFSSFRTNYVHVHSPFFIKKKLWGCILKYLKNCCSWARSTPIYKLSKSYFTSHTRFLVCKKLNERKKTKQRILRKKEARKLCDQKPVTSRTFHIRQLFPNRFYHVTSDPQ